MRLGIPSSPVTGRAKLHWQGGDGVQPLCTMASDKERTQRR